MARRRYKKKSGGMGKVIGILLLLGLVGGGAYVYTSPEFEQVKPTISGAENIYWNLKSPIKLTFNDNEALKSYEVVMSDGKNSIIIGKGEFTPNTKTQTLLIPYPKNKVLDKKSPNLTITAKVTDASKWNMFSGNSTIKQFKINVDYKRPNVNILSNSRSINQGGSALVVFQASDDNLKDLYILANNHKFIPTPYKTEGYYASLIAWPFTENSFDAKIVATDKAGNKKETHIPLYHHNPKYPTSYIKASDRFIDGKITDLASSNPEYANIDDRLARLKAINETMRLNNEKLIHKLSSKTSDDLIISWDIKRFKPLKNAKKVASFGAHRYYYYGSKDNVVSESYHLGYDLASTKMASIVASNPGVVVFAGENGIYGNMPLIDHGLGLYTLYGHCSELFVKEGDEVNRGQVIAKTGMTGLALGDHLHFGILVQGIEVRPVEWFDQHWIDTFITNVFKEADKIIGENK
jgi:murein DD-endopeptidase MepM/ murein hydrolase activator NlpD